MVVLRKERAVKCRMDQKNRMGNKPGRDIVERFLSIFEKIVEN